MVTLTTAQNALKEVYLSAISAELNTKTDPVFAMIKQSSADVYGKNIIKLVPYGINGGVGAGAEDSALPNSQENKYTNFTTTLKNLYGSVEISDKAIRASANDEGAFLNLLNAEMDGLLNASKFNLSRMFYGDGTGSLIPTISSVNTVEKSFVTTNVNNLQIGMVVDFYLSGTLDTNMTGIVINNIDRTNKKVYLSNVSSTFNNTNKANYKMYVQGSKDNELTGINYIFGSSSTLYGVSRSNYANIMPYKYTKTNEDTFNENFIQTQIDKVESISNIQPNIILCGGDSYYNIISLLSTYAKNVDTNDLKAGVVSVAFCGIPMVRNKFSANNELAILNTEQFTLHQLCDWEWLSNNDGSILKQKEGYPAYKATLVKYADLICNRPQAQGLITL